MIVYHIGSIMLVCVSLIARLLVHVPFLCLLKHKQSKRATIPDLLDLSKDQNGQSLNPSPVANQAHD